MKLRMFASAAIVAGAVVATAAPASAGPQERVIPGTTAVAQSKPLTFPYMFSRVKGAPTYDSNGKPSPWNNVVWDHATVLTRSQTAMVRNSGGVRDVIGSTQIAPYSGLARAATAVIRSDGALLNKGGCLTLYWSDHRFVGPSGKLIQTAAQVLAADRCMN